MDKKTPTTRGMTLNGHLKDKVKVLAAVNGHLLPFSELIVLSNVIDFSVNNSLAISIDIAKQIKKEANLSESSFSTSLHRLVQKGFLVRSGKTVTIHPIFAGVKDMDKLLISFNLNHPIP